MANSDTNKGPLANISLNGLTWSKTLMLCSILLCAGVAGYFGVSVSLNVSLADRVSNVENRMDIPVNSTLSAFQKSNTFLVIPHGIGVCLMNGSGYFQEFLANQTQVIMDGLNNASISGGSVYVQAGSYSASVIIQNNTRFILEKGATGITYSVASDAYCILDDFNSGIFQYYANGSLYSQFDYAHSNLLLLSANLTSVYATTLDQLSSGQGVKVLHFIVENGTSFPAIPIEKQVFFRTDQGYLYVYSSGSWTPIGAVPSTYPWANLTGVPLLIYANGSQALTADWNVSGYGIYSATWLNSTQMNTSDFWLNGQNRTDTLAYPIEPLAYVIDFSDGITARVKNCTTGQVDYANSNQTLAMQYAFNHTDWTGAHGTQKVVLRGNFSLNYYPNVPAYADIEIQGYMNVSNHAAFMLCFDDGIPIQYTTYFPNMTSIWGYRGNQGIMVDWVSHAGATNSSYETLANLQAMKNAGWSFYSHGWYSIDLSAATVTLLQQDKEIRQSKDWIERNLGVRIDSIQWGSAKQGDLEIARQYYNYLAYGNWKSWPNQTWNYISDTMSAYFPTETNFNGSKQNGGVIANAAWYAVNSTGSGSNGELAILTFHGTMTSYWFNLCMGNLSSYGLPVLTWRDVDYYLSKQPKPTIAGADITLRNEGNQTACVNGTWIKHNLGVIPNATSVTLGNFTYINSTAYYIGPFVIAASMNSTWFQVEFLIWNAGTITPVAATDQRTLIWTAYYEKIVIYPAQS